MKTGCYGLTFYSAIQTRTLRYILILLSIPFCLMITLLNLCFSYNGNDNDPIYGVAPPAVGLIFLSGGVVFSGNPNDTVYVCRGGVRSPFIGYKDLKLRVFNSYLNGQDPHNYRESYR